MRVDDLIRVCKDLAKSQDFYGRLLAQLEEMDEQDLSDIDSAMQSANLKDDLDADSLDAVEIVMSAEEEFDIEIPDEVAMNIKTVKDIVEYIENNQ